MSDRAYIQVQDVTGKWRTLETVYNNDISIKTALDKKVAFMGKRLRAIDEKGSVLDLRS